MGGLGAQAVEGEATPRRQPSGALSLTALDSTELVAKTKTRSSPVKSGRRDPACRAR
ncbi:hypothetical protein [Streptomyces chartreusis]|uniref:hypothetical protein n=1 Tax=Streptomyces chartreusis TaxID=1969 RepID=UPI003434A6F0